MHYCVLASGWAESSAWRLAATPKAVKIEEGLIWPPPYWNRLEASYSSTLIMSLHAERQRSPIDKRG